MRKLKQITFLSFIFIVTVAFNFQHNPPSNWYQQLLPDISKQPISSMTFIDSLTGYAVTGAKSPSDTNYILKTTNGGDNWLIVNRLYRDFSKVQFLNKDTGFVSGGLNVSLPLLLKTTNGGMNWVQIMTVPATLYYDDMFVLTKDTIWLVDNNSFNGGIYRTTNGGTNWEVQYSVGSNNPNKIYMYNSRIGFSSKSDPFIGKIYKTTNCGENWIQVLNEGFYNVKFIDSLIGWECNGAGDSSVKKTINGGVNWFKQQLPVNQNGNIMLGSMVGIAAINKDTLFGVGGAIVYPNLTQRPIIYKTTNGGTNWGYQVPDTNINLFGYSIINFLNKNTGWAYNRTQGGIHTKLGGDTTIITHISSNHNSTVNNFTLMQNYPNPFNPETKIAFNLQISGYVTLKVYNLQGKEITTLINERKNSGFYTANFNSSTFNLSSGIYFYTINVSNEKQKFNDTKKMILVK